MLPSMSGQLLDATSQFARRRGTGEQTADNREPPRNSLRRELRFSRGNCFSISLDEAPFKGVSSFYSLAKWSGMGKLCGFFKSSKKRDSNRPNDPATTTLSSSSGPAATRQFYEIVNHSQVGRQSRKHGFRFVSRRIRSQPRHQRDNVHRGTRVSELKDRELPVLKYDESTRKKREPETMRPKKRKLGGIVRRRQSVQKRLRRSIESSSRPTSGERPCNFRKYWALWSLPPQPACYSATITMRHLGHEAQGSLHRLRGAFCRTELGRSSGKRESRSAAGTGEVKGSDKHPAKGGDGSRMDRRRDAASGLLGSGR